MANTGTGAMLSGGAKRKRSHKFACGVPMDKCTGSNGSVSNGLRKNVKLHGSPEEAFACYANYLLKQGYTQIGSHEFAAPNNGPVTVLTRKSKFGALLRGGKADRQMPKRNCGGHIVSC